MVPPHPAQPPAVSPIHPLLQVQVPLLFRCERKPFSEACRVPCGPALRAAPAFPHAPIAPEGPSLPSGKARSLPHPQPLCPSRLLARLAPVQLTSPSDALRAPGPVL